MSNQHTDIIHNRFLGFLLWQSVQSTAIYLLTKSILLSPFTSNPFIPSFFGFATFLSFHLSMILFSVSIHAVATPQRNRAASVTELALGLLRFVFTASSPPAASDFRRRMRVSLGAALLISAAAFSGFLAVVSIVGSSFRGSFGELVNGLGLRGFVVGLVYGVGYVFREKWVLVFPIVQRPAFFSFKMGIQSSIKQALKISTTSYLFSAILVAVLASYTKSLPSGDLHIADYLILYIAIYVVILSWELSHHLHKVLLTKRFVFAPPKGSAAVEANPSEPLLAGLEESTPRSLVQYLAYLDLSAVCGSNIDPWRRSAFFEETGETYKRVMAICMRPLEQFTSKLGEGLSGSVNGTYNLSNQLCSPGSISENSEVVESFNDFQLYAWCARAASSLTIHSHKEDRFGVAQLSGSHAAVLSTMLSCLLGVETFMGKKTHLQSPNHLLGPGGIKWATNSTTRREISMAVNKKRDSPLYSKAYSLVDVLKVSIYSIVSEFHEEMAASSKSGALGKDWIATSKPIYGSTELLVQKLQFFLNFQAS